MTAELGSHATGKIPDGPGRDPAGGLIIQQFTSNDGTKQQRDVAPDDGALRIPSLATGIWPARSG
jgi:hypothetical protein